MKHKAKRVLVAMSGGVDSSVAAFLLKKKGYEVVGVTMCFGLKDSSRKRPNCCSISSIEDARRVAEQLGIRHYALSFGRILEEQVIREFVKEYLSGRTPNPCIRCNQFLKFDRLLAKAKELSCDYLATGHYAKIACGHNGKILLQRATDRKKDQSYFLFRLPRAAGKFILFPLGGYTKDRVRAIARQQKLRVADKPGSQDVCFIPDGDYKEFLKQRCGKKIMQPGPIKNTEGSVLGKHNGVMFYTIGQRQGLGIAHAHPLYVKQILPETNTIIVGGKQEIYARTFEAGALYMLHASSLLKKLEVNVKIRYNHPQARARITALGGGRIRVEFSRPQWAITPGQSAVFYKNNIVVGGATIEKVVE